MAPPLTATNTHEQFVGASAGQESARDLYFHFGHTDVPIRYCPGCLAEREPYFRLDWRLAFVTVCPRHRLPLLEHCDYCKALCLFTKVDVQRPFGSCHHCHWSLAGMGKDVDGEMALQIELHLEFQETVLSVLRKRQPVGMKEGSSELSQESL